MSLRDSHDRLRDPHFGRRAEARESLVASFAARDPGHARFTRAFAISAGVLISALVSMLVVDASHADKGLLAMAVFFSLQAGNAAKDSGGIHRLVTTSLLVPAVVVAILSAALLSSWRPVQMIVFVAIAGIAIWVRRLGPREAAIGQLTFIGYFFALFMQTTFAQAPLACAIGTIAIGAQVIVRAILLLSRPRRQITVLLHELRAASASALQAAAHNDRPGVLRARLARIDDVGRAIESWQRDFPTGRYIDCNADTLDTRVLDARVETEEACYELARHADAGRGRLSGDLRRALADLSAVLQDRSDDEHAADVAEQVLTGHLKVDDRLAIDLVRRSASAHARLRTIDLSHGAPGEVLRAPTLDAPRPDDVAAGAPTIKRNAWKQWSPTSRMAVQAMVAALIAATVGEALSASRWYWAVMTAFVVFIGATTRSGILTRAYRRVIGTALGIGLGVAAVALTHDNPNLLIAIGVIGVFGMLYFGPLNYLYASMFITIMLVAIYGMLGVLNFSLLDLRLEETLAGAVIGVLCAYLILTSDSRSALLTKIDTYFDDLDRLLESASRSFSTGREDEDLRPAFQSLEASQDDLDTEVTAMSTAFLFTDRRAEADAVHLMYIASRSAARLTQTAAEGSRGSLDHQDSAAVPSAIKRVRVRTAIAKASFDSATRVDLARSDGSFHAAEFENLDSSSQRREALAIMALARIDWALRKLAGLRSSPASGTRQRA